MAGTNCEKCGGEGTLRMETGHGTLEISRCDCKPPEFYEWRRQHRKEKRDRIIREYDARQLVR